MRESGEFEAMPKKEALLLTRELDQARAQPRRHPQHGEAARGDLRARHRQGAHRGDRGQQARHPDRGRGRHQLRPRRHPVRHPRQRRRHPLRHPHVPDHVRRRRRGPLHLLAQATATVPARPWPAPPTKSRPSPPSRPRPAARRRQAAAGARARCRARPNRQAPPGIPRRRPGTPPWPPAADVRPAPEAARWVRTRGRPPADADDGARSAPRRGRARSCRPPARRRPTTPETARAPACRRSPPPASRPGSHRPRDAARSRCVRRAPTDDQGVSTRPWLTSPPRTCRPCARATGAGMMDAKKALTEENGGDADAAAKWLREKGLAKAAGRSDRDNSQGTVAVSHEGNGGRHRRAQVRDRLRGQVRPVHLLGPGDRHPGGGRGRASAAAKADGHRRPEGRAQGEHRARTGGAGRGRRGPRARHLRAPPGRPWRERRHRRAATAATSSWPTSMAVHIAFTKPTHLSREDVPRPRWPRSETFEGITRAEGKPEAAMDKIVEGRLTGWFKERVAARAELRQGREADHHPTAGWQHRSCGSPRW